MVGRALKKTTLSIVRDRLADPVDLEQEYCLLGRESFKALKECLS